MSVNDLCIGIDLGTTNSVLATVNVRPNGNIVCKVVDISRAVDVYNSVSSEARLSTMKKPTLPSCVFYRQERDYEPLVGDFAKLQYPLRPHLVAKSIKSQMGKSLAEGLSPDIPDKTPAEISSRILQHMLREASKIYKCPITEAVITVPANFDSVMCKATQDAAELAGISVRNPDGTDRPILLSEPNAVIYDLINQIHNGEIADNILDLSSMKRVLVFDLGGGTLDITMHEIKRRDNAPEILKVDEIATNRYTRLGGDDFDQAIAIEMFKRYQRQYSKSPGVVALLKQKESVIMAQLLTYAENVKLDLSMQCSTESSYSSGWYDEDEEITMTTGGSMGGIGYAYDDTFTKEEIESILSPFMGNELKYEDYKNLPSVKDTRNIIYPILDVLKKASEKLGSQDVQVDAVIVNGGMSKFYMITERLKAFFGFEPIVALDPDQSVARGAAVYHHLLKQHAEIQDDMRIVHSEVSTKPEAEKINLPEQQRVNIEWGKSILNDALYIGMRNSAVQMIIPTGAALPYDSEIMTGFRIDPFQSLIAIPIKSQNIDGSYRTIANGNIKFSQNYPEGSYVAFTIHMGKNKVISMKAWTSSSVDGRHVIEKGTAEIDIESLEQSSAKVKMIPPAGTKLNVANELRTFIQLCLNFSQTNTASKRSSLAQRIRDCGTNIMKAENRREFVKPILDALSSSQTNDEAKMRLFTLARKISEDFTDKEKKRLAEVCIQQVKSEILGFELSKTSGQRLNANIQAIYTLSICADKETMRQIEALHANDLYLNSCLYAHAKTRTSINWILDRFNRDIETMKHGKNSSLQVSAHAVAVALKNDGECPVPENEREKIVKKLINGINSGKIFKEPLLVCVLALGTICDNRKISSPCSDEVIREVEACINAIPNIYSSEAMTRAEQNCFIALKLIRGQKLDEAEERYLLTKLEI